MTRGPNLSWSLQGCAVVVDVPRAREGSIPVGFRQIPCARASMGPSRASAAAARHMLRSRPCRSARASCCRMRWSFRSRSGRSLRRTCSRVSTANQTPTLKQPGARRSSVARARHLPTLTMMSPGRQCAPSCTRIQSADEQAGTASRQAREEVLEAAKRYGEQRPELKRFPYSVYFIELPSRFRVLAFAHARRKPRYWLKRR
jgi:hypothetical protein